EGRELYREFTNWAVWVHVVTWGAIGGSALVTPWPWSVVLIALGVLIYVVLGGLLVTVHSDGVRVGLGHLRLLRAFIPFADVTRIESVTYRPLKEFGGWGLRGGKQKRAWTARGDRAVVLHTRDDRRIYIGSDEPSKLEGRIRTAMIAG
ncbi:MAG TPA: hypothetical protein VJ925_13385, partial [Longimicrobiales bacterium]|nr:hypothetical protein [Longimicrobiales bacterium]